MEAWGPGPFDNDEAAEFAVALDRAPLERRAAIVRDALAHVIEHPSDVDEETAAQAVAAAALVAAQRPGGPPAAAIYGPEQPLPALPDDVANLAVRALDAVLTAHADTAARYGETPVGAEWRQRVASLQDSLAS